MSAPTPPQLGEFTLLEVVSSGRGAQLWRGRHAGGAPAWVRVRTSRSALRPSYFDAFRQTVHLLAGVDHPCVVPPLAYGRAGAAAPKLPEGAPWLATPVAPGGTLADRLARHGPLPWPAARAALERTLRGLGAAHARGLLHLDLHPGALVFGAAARRAHAGAGALALTDWPAAQAGPEGGIRPGTPGRMAPEQVDGAWTRLGPWTDLYAVGVLAWELVVGAPPFGAGSRQAVLFRQLQEGPGPFAPAHPVPAELEPWIRGLLAAHPGDRLRCAADALRALGALGPAIAPTDAAVLGQPTRRMDAAAVARLTTGRPAPGEAVPVPLAPGRPWDPRMRAAGASLAAARPRPPVTHSTLREQLWGALSGVHRTGSARAIGLWGPPQHDGPGLARWLVQAALEAGLACTVVHAHCGAGPARARGVVPALGRALGLDRVAPIDAPAAAAARLAELGAEERWLVSGLAAAWTPSRPAGGAAPRPELLAARTLGALSAHRPVLVWIDQADRDDEALAVISHLLQRRQADPLRALLLLTGEREPAGLGGLESWPVPALSPVEARRLLRSVHGDAADGAPPPDLAALAADPALALHGATDLQARLQAALAGPDSAAMQAAELGALLGFVLDPAPWAALWGGAVADVGAALVEAGLARPRPGWVGGGWVLPQRVRDALLAHAQARGRLPAAHAAAAAALAAQGGGHPADRVDLAWHHLEAGATSLAWSTASAAARAWQGLGRPWRAREAAALAGAALARSGAGRGRRATELALLEAEISLSVGQPDAAHASLTATRPDPAPDLAARHAGLSGEVAAAQGRTEAALAALARARQLAQQHGQPDTFAQATLSLAALHERRGQPAAAVPLLREVLALPPRPERPALPAQARVALAAAARASGDLVEAGAQLRQAVREAQTAVSPALLIQARCEQARVHRLRDRPAEATRALDLALEAARHLGDAALLAEVWEERGAVHRATGDLPRAERAFARATTWARTAGRSHTLPLLRLGRVRSALGQHGQGRADLEAALERCTRLGESVWIPACHAGLVETAAAMGDWMVFDLGLADLGARTAEGPAQGAEIAAPLERAGALAASHGHLQRAEAAWAQAAGLWRAAGHPDRAGALDRARGGDLEDAPTEEAPHWLRELSLH